MSHWYDFSGNSKHEVTGKSTGRPRATTIKDARENGWFPSVTTVLDILSKPQLDTWKQDQVALALRRLLAAGRSLPEENKAFCAIVRTEAFTQVKDAADLGTRLHAALEQWWNGKDYDQDLHPYIEAVPKLLETHGITLTGHELRLVSPHYGYAGTTDAPFKTNDGRVGILDFKSRKSDPRYPMDAYDGQATQIAAYHAAHYGVEPAAGSPICGANVFISTTEPGRVEVVMHDDATLAREWTLFKHLLRVWQIRNNYVPPVPVTP